VSKIFYKASGGRLVEAISDSAEEFFRSVRLALGRPRTSEPDPLSSSFSYSQDARSVALRASDIMRDVAKNAEHLLVEFGQSATEAGWTVTRLESHRYATEYIRGLIDETQVRFVATSSHPIVGRLGLSEAFSGQDVDIQEIALKNLIDESNQGSGELHGLRDLLRQKVLRADLGVTGVDYGIAETGSCVLLAGEGVSRLVSLVPPIYVALVEKGQVLPSLDEFFTLHRDRFLKQGLGSYMNIISGPSRSADIEQTLVTGVHGPGNVHLLLVG